MLNISANPEDSFQYNYLVEHLITGLTQAIASNNQDPSELINLFVPEPSVLNSLLLKRYKMIGHSLENGLHPVTVGVHTLDDIYRFVGKQRILFTSLNGDYIPIAFLKRINTLDQIWVTSTAAVQALIDNGIKPEIIKQMPPFIDTELWQSRFEHKDTGKFNILMYGRFEEQQASKEGIEGFLKAFNEHPDIANIKLTCKFLFKERCRPIHRIKSEVAHLLNKYPRAAARIKLIETISPDMLSVLDDTSCLLFAPKHEEFAHIWFQASSYGIPSIVSPCGIMNDYIQPDLCLVLPDRGKTPATDTYYPNTHENHLGSWNEIKADDIAKALLEMYNMGYEKRMEMGQIATKKIKAISLLEAGQKALEFIKELK